MTQRSLFIQNVIVRNCPLVIISPPISENWSTKIREAKAFIVCCLEPDQLTSRKVQKPELNELFEVMIS